MTAPSRARVRFALALGAVLQALVLGSGLFLALTKMFAVSTGAQVFRYQGF